MSIQYRRVTDRHYRQTYRRTDILPRIVRVMHTRRAVKIKLLDFWHRCNVHNCLSSFVQFFQCELCYFMQCSKTALQDFF